MSWSLFIRNLVFTILQPGIVVFLVPYLLIRNRPFDYSGMFSALPMLGIVLFLIGLIIMLECIARFGWQGKGTLSPADPTRNLVVRGLYRYSRNPMYVGVILQLIGISLCFGFTSLWIYTGLVFLAFNLFIVFVEEPRLRRDFGQEYAAYTQQVRRWF